MKGYGLFWGPVYTVFVTPVTVFPPALLAFVTQPSKGFFAHPQLGNVYA